MTINQDRSVWCSFDCRVVLCPPGRLQHVLLVAALLGYFLVCSSCCSVTHCGSVACDATAAVTQMPGGSLDRALRCQAAVIGNSSSRISSLSQEEDCGKAEALAAAWSDYFRPVK